MYDQDSGFYSAQDADSEGEEGKYYVWNIDEIKSIIDSNDADKFIKYYGLTKSGNFEHNNILHKEIVIIGRRDKPEVQKALRMIYERYIPNRIIVFYDPDEMADGMDRTITLLEGRLDNKADLTIYICENNVCKKPITKLDDLENAL